MKLAPLLLVVIAAVACSTTPAARSETASTARVSTPSTAGSPNPHPTPAAYAVIVKDFLVEGGADYTVALVATDGHTVVQATARKRSHGVQIGNLSTSNTTLYYLDGDSDVHYLRPDGSTGLATHVSLGPNQVAAFAVSPDDLRIAVSVLDFTRYPVGTKLYVEDLSGGGNHVELFSSPTVLEWPAGWHGGRLVVAVGRNAPPQNAYEGFERGSGYHIADAQTGNRLLSLCDGGDSFFPESQAGTVCVKYPNASVVSWDGVVQAVPMAGTCALWGPLSPAGVMANRTASTPTGGCTGGDNIYLVEVVQNVGYDQNPRVVASHATPEGWIDSNHLVVMSDPPLSGSSVVDTTRDGVNPGKLSPIAAQGFFAAALPGAL
jgi:hypothetical protein